MRSTGRAPPRFVLLVCRCSLCFQTSRSSPVSKSNLHIRRPARTGSGDRIAAALPVQARAILGQQAVTVILPRVAQGPILTRGLAHATVEIAILGQL